MDSRTAQALDVQGNDIEELRRVLLIIVRDMEHPDRNIIDEARQLMDFLERYKEESEDD